MGRRSLADVKRIRIDRDVPGETCPPPAAGLCLDVINHATLRPDSPNRNDIAAGKIDRILCENVIGAAIVAPQGDGGTGVGVTIRRATGIVCGSSIDGGV